MKRLLSFILPLRAGLFLALCITAGSTALFADPPVVPPVPYHSYTYGIWETSVPATPAYLPLDSVNGYDLGIGALKNPKDLHRDIEGNIWLLDSGNSRIVVLDSDMALVRVIDRFYDTEGTEFSLNDPRGVTTDSEQRIYVADRGSKRVLVFNKDVQLLFDISKPKTDLIDESIEFLPENVLVDNLGVLYVLSFGSYRGAWTFARNGAFLGFYGSNKVNVDGRLRRDLIWRKFMTKEQRERMYRFVPVEYANFTIDEEGFIYTVSNFGENEQKGQVKKLNPLSQNILWAGRKPELAFFGDLEEVWTNRVEKSRLVAIDVDDKNFINVLDTERGRVFQYDQSCNLVTIFGGPGDQVGTFRNAVDLVSSNNRIFVLDEVKGSLTAFEPGMYGNALREGTVLFEDGYYEEAREHWFRALAMDRNNYIVLRGLGRAFEHAGDYKEAMYYYKESNNRRGYSESFREYRLQILREYFGLLMFILALLIASPFIVGALRKRYGKGPGERVVFQSTLRFPFYLLRHPFKGWDELKLEKKGSLLYANIILAVFFILTIIEYQFTGFIFNPNRLDRMNIIVLFGMSIGIFVLWTISNWGVSTLHDGKGSFKEIWIFTAYSLLPMILVSLPLVIVSNFIVQDEGDFLTIFQVAGQLWFVIHFVVAVRGVHQYTLKTTLWSILLSVIGIILIVIVVVLFVSLFMQVFGFGTTLLQEILLRL